MLRGTIDVQSEVGQGTDITIRIPLSRIPGTDTPASTPSSEPSVDGGSQDDSMRALQADYQATTVALYAFNSNECTSEMTHAGRMLKDCIEDWFGLRTCSSVSRLTSEDLIVVDENNLAKLADENATHIPTVVICSNATRSQAASSQNIAAVTEFISKPFGPHKFAKAVRLCLDKARNYHLERTPVITFLDGRPNSFESEVDDTAPDLEHLTLETEDVLHPLNVQTNGIVTVSGSDNAQMAIEHWNTDSSNGSETVTDGQKFPFPDQSQHGDSETNPSSPRSPQNENVRPMGDLTRRDSRRPRLISRVTEPAVKTRFPHSREFSNHASSAVSKDGETARLGTDPPLNDTAKANILDGTTAASLTASNMALHNNENPNETLKVQPEKREKRPPRLLLVDDNKINLRLLETYMRKRKYQLVDSAENGQLAVQAAESSEDGYDIIFMDISMPIMNGFEATRAIREIEEARSRSRSHDQLEPNRPHTSPALIIALTGLASSRDQTEAFTSGVDLFMTKPVSFKEVGRLLDNWEANGGLNRPSSSAEQKKGERK